jgi:hypothetical protein
MKKEQEIFVGLLEGTRPLTFKHDEMPKNAKKKKDQDDKDDPF